MLDRIHNLLPTSPRGCGEDRAPVDQSPVSAVINPKEADVDQTRVMLELSIGADGPVVSHKEQIPPSLRPLDRDQAAIHQRLLDLEKYRDLPIVLYMIVSDITVSTRNKGVLTGNDIEQIIIEIVEYMKLAGFEEDSFPVLLISSMLSGDTVWT